MGESRVLVFSSVKNWREKMMVTVMVRMRMKRLTCWYRSRLERVLSLLLEAPEDLQQMKDEN